MRARGILIRGGVQIYLNEKAEFRHWLHKTGLLSNLKLLPVWVADDKQQMYQRINSLPWRQTRF